MKEKHQMLPIIPKTPIDIRPATLADLPAIDALQKQFPKALGYFRTAQLKGYLATGGVLAARDPVGRLIGYILWRDRYLKRDELGVIFQLCVDPAAHRHLVGASLVKAAFERSAYGCRLFCLWCAQDLEANRFWESLGFIPIAFRAGSGKRRRVHIFWQRRVRADDAATPYWFPARTSNGAIREDRLVLPIPPGVKWNDPIPIILHRNADETAAPPRRLPSTAKNASGLVIGGPARSKFDLSTSRMRFDLAKSVEEPKKKQHVKAAPVPLDPRVMSAARELRDRWLERVNAGELALADTKYDLARIRQSTPDHDQAKPTQGLPTLQTCSRQRHRGQLSDALG